MRLMASREPGRMSSRPEMILGIDVTGGSVRPGSTRCSYESVRVMVMRGD
jgi:hypothetical protein